MITNKKLTGFTFIHFCGKICKSAISLLWGSDFLQECELVYAKYCFSLKRAHPYIIYAMDGRFNHRGLADKIRGMVSTYALAKARQKEFRIDHVDPFDIEDFLSPNEYYWKLSDGEMSNNWLRSWPVIILDYDTPERIRKYSRQKQYHFYTNVDFIEWVNLHYGKGYSFTELYKELFKPSRELFDELLPYRQFIEEGYVSVSFRFLNLLGDFKDVVSNEILGEKEQNDLIARCISFIGSLYQRNCACRYVLVTSDSMKFQNAVQSLEYTFSVPGEISHSGVSSNWDAVMKTFVDFYMISLAKKAYLGYSGKMYKSNFARTAAASSGIPFEVIEF